MKNKGLRVQGLGLRPSGCDPTSRVERFGFHAPLILEFQPATSSHSKIKNQRGSRWEAPFVSIVFDCSCLSD
jgi:hypothetical protein